MPFWSTRHFWRTPIHIVCLTFVWQSIIQSVTMALERSVAQYETNQDG